MFPFITNKLHTYVRFTRSPIAFHPYVHSTTEIVNVDENVESNIIDIRTRVILESNIGTQDKKPTWTLETLNQNHRRRVNILRQSCQEKFVFWFFRFVARQSDWSKYRKRRRNHIRCCKKPLLIERENQIKSDYVILSSINLIAISMKVSKHFENTHRRKKILLMRVQFTSVTVNIKNLKNKNHQDILLTLSF